MIGKVTIKSSGYDPAKGRANFDPTLEPAKVQDRHRMAGAILADKLAMQGMLRVGSKIDTCAEVIADTEAETVERCCAAVCGRCRAVQAGVDLRDSDTPDPGPHVCNAIRQAMADEGGGCDE